MTPPEPLQLDQTEEPTGPGGGRRRARKRRSVPGCLAVLVALAVIVGGFYFVVTWGIDKVGDQFSSAADYDGPGHGKVTFQVVSGDSAAAIGRRLKEQGVTKVFLVGSDYVFPRTANKEIIAYAGANGIEIVGEEYAPLGHTDFSTIVTKLKGSGAQAVFNTLNGDSNVAFFKEYKNVGLTAETVPVVSVSIAEEEVGGIGVDNIVGQLTAWNYYQTVESPENEKFVAAFKAEYGDDRVTSDPMEAAYTSLYLWKGMVEKAINDLPEKQRLVLALYYYEDMNLKEIGRVLEVTESRVSQLHTQAILRLKGKLKNNFDEFLQLLA